MVVEQGKNKVFFGWFRFLILLGEKSKFDDLEYISFFCTNLSGLVQPREKNPQNKTPLNFTSIEREHIFTTNAKKL